ncbi:MAG: hypothetical protein WD404_01070 [Solirubrobacterales bacterium]
MEADPLRTFRVVLTGAFSTGVALRVPVSDYACLQEELERKLNCPESEREEECVEGLKRKRKRGEGGEWNRDGVPWRKVFSYDEGGGGYSNLVPLVPVQREGPELTRRLREREKALRGSLEMGWTWELEDVRVQFFDLGVGVISGAYTVVPPEGLAPKDVAQRIRAWSDLTRDARGNVGPPIGASYEELAIESVETFSAAVKQCEKGEVLSPWLTLLQSPPERPTEQGSGESMTEHAIEEEERGRLKWLHPVFVLPSRPDSDDERDAEAKEFGAVHKRAVDFEHGLFVPGVKRSVVALNGEAERRERDEGWDLLGPSTPLGLIALNWAYHALFMDIDRGLLATLDRSGRHGDRATFRELEAEARDAYRDYVRVREAKARLDSALNGLGSGQVSLWEALADVTRFERLEASVESKLEALQTIAESRVQEAAAESARRSRQILTGLTALTLVTFAVALIGHFWGGRTDSVGHPELRIGVVALAFLLAVALFLLAEHGRFWKRRDWPRPWDRDSRPYREDHAG